ncbi:type II toxin-antitoxin system RelB family antitoxin [Streptococcus ratti]|uniref:CopG family transcriptional regulator n=1 Tax=Streptococcus ratti TaxID=1341 RepID=A0A7X9LDQ2_STRRT|nr:hypothetical protein [Streptococcus ratti]
MSKRSDFTAVPTSVRLSDELNEKLTLWTNSHNISKSEFIAQVLAEKLEDLYDIQEADLAMRDWLDNGQVTYSHDEMMKRYG